MFFILSKVLGFFTLPSDIAATFAAIGVVLLFTRFRRTGRALATLGVVLLVVGIHSAWELLVWMALAVSERRRDASATQPPRAPPP